MLKKPYEKIHQIESTVFYKLKVHDTNYLATELQFNYAEITEKLNKKTGEMESKTKDNWITQSLSVLRVNLPLMWFLMLVQVDENKIGTLYREQLKAFLDSKEDDLNYTTEFNAEYKDIVNSIKGAGTYLFTEKLSSNTDNVYTIDLRKLSKEDSYNELEDDYAIVIRIIHIGNNKRGRTVLIDTQTHLLSKEIVDKFLETI